MKNKFVILLINIIFLLAAIFLMNWIVYKYLYPKLELVPKKYSDSYSFKRYRTDYNWLKETYQNNLRKPEGLEYNQKSVILFGCSYAYGHLLEDKQTFHYKLAHVLKRPVYNYASSGQSPQFALMRIRSHDLDNLIRNSDYIIFVTIGEHIWRVHTNSAGFPREYIWPTYENKNGNLVFHHSKFPIIEGSYLYKFIQKLIYSRILTQSKSKIVQNYMFDFVKLHFEEMKKEAELINPNIKFIIITFGDGTNPLLYTSSPRLKELEDEGFIIFDVDKLIGDNKPQDFYIPNDGHPSEIAWDMIIDMMVNKTKIIK